MSKSAHCGKNSADYRDRSMSPPHKRYGFRGGSPASPRSQNSHKIGTSLFGPANASKLLGASLIAVKGTTCTLLVNLLTQLTIDSKKNSVDDCFDNERHRWGENNVPWFALSVQLSPFGPLYLAGRGLAPRHLFSTCLA